MTPPPRSFDLNFEGIPSISTNQSNTWVSTSVHEGLVSQSIPTMPVPVAIISASIAGPLDPAGKNA